MRQTMSPIENVSDRMPRTPEEKTRVGDAVLRLLKLIPETWATFEPARQTSIEGTALFHLTAAGLVERRQAIRAKMADSSIVIEIRYEATGEGGPVEAFEQACPTLFKQWQPQWEASVKVPTGAGAPFHLEEVPPAEWRLSDQGVIARDGLGNPKGVTHAMDFVLKQGFFGPGHWVRKMKIGRFFPETDQKVIAEQLAATGSKNADPAELPRPPVRGYGRVLTIRQLPRESPSSNETQDVNVANWQTGASAMASAISEALREMFKAASPCSPPEFSPESATSNAERSPLQPVSPAANEPTKRTRKPSKHLHDAKFPKPPKVSANAWMLTVLGKHPESSNWSIRQWELAIGVSKAAISATDAWKAQRATRAGVRFAAGRRPRRPNTTTD